MERILPGQNPEQSPSLSSREQSPYVEIYRMLGYQWSARMTELAEEAQAISPMPHLEDLADDPAREVFAAFYDEAQRIVDEINRQDIPSEAKNRAYQGFLLAITELAQRTQRLELARLNAFDLLLSLNQSKSRESIEALVAAGFLEEPTIDGVIPYSPEWVALGGPPHPDAAERREEFEAAAVAIVESVLSFPESLETPMGLDPVSISDESVSWPRLQSAREVHLFQNALNRALLEGTGVDPRTTPVHREYTTRVYTDGRSDRGNPEMHVIVYECFIPDSDVPLYLHRISPVAPHASRLKNPLYAGWAIGADISL